MPQSEQGTSYQLFEGRIGQPDILYIPGTNRVGSWSLEVPDWPNKDMFVDMALELLPSAQQECHPLLRQANQFVRFCDYPRGASGLGASSWANRETKRVSTEVSNQRSR